MLPTYYFDRYTLRPAGPADLPLAQAWSEADDDHRGNVPATFWVDGKDSYLLLVAKAGWAGELCQFPVFFFKIETARNREAKVYMQFADCETKECRRRTMDGLVAGLRWLEKMLVDVGYETVYFTSKRRELIAFCTRRLGFTLKDNILRKNITA